MTNTKGGEGEGKGTTAYLEKEKERCVHHRKRVAEVMERIVLVSALDSHDKLLKFAVLHTEA